jgi:hypothetical protein
MHLLLVVIRAQMGDVAHRSPLLSFYTMEVLTGPPKEASAAHHEEVVFLYHLGQGELLMSTLKAVCSFHSYSMLDARMLTQHCNERSPCGSLV